MKLSHLVNTMPGTFSYAQPRCILYYKLYLFCKENNRRLELNDTVFFCHLSVLKGGDELLQGRWTGGGHVFSAKCNFNLSIVYFHFKKSYFLYNCCQRWLDTLHYLLKLPIH